jgi:hypothetical protein
VFLDEKFGHGSRPDGPYCRACRQPIHQGERAMRVEFQNDPDGTKGLTGEYHAACGRRFASLARVVNMNLWGGH